MKFTDWQKEVVDSKPGDQRLGQWAYNCLYHTNPKLANNIRGSNLSDPFYDDTNLRSFWFRVRTQGDWDG